MHLVDGERCNRVRIVSLLIGLLGVRALVLPTGLDRLTTVTWTTPLVLVMAGVAAVAVFSILLRELGITMARTRAAALSAIFAVAIFIVAGTLLGVMAQHVPGTIVASTAMIERVERSKSMRNACRLKVRARLEHRDGAISFCVRTARGGSIGPNEIKAGDVMKLRLRETVLGTIVESASRDS